LKVVINNCVGGFNISQKAFERLIELGWSVTNDWDNDAADIREHDDELLDKYTFVSLLSDPSLRSNPELIRVIEELGDAANDEHSKLKTIEIPDGVEFGIGENETGYEWVYEKHRTWR
jgi:hypothetical protein